jgi:sec-independent protein translocase protein TatA
LTALAGWPRIHPAILFIRDDILGRPPAVRITSQESDMFGKLGLPEILIILAIALLIFGPRRLGELGKGLGEGIKNFKSSVKDGENPPEEKK